MAGDGIRYTDDLPGDVEARLREICLELPDAFEERAWKGTRWKVRSRSFAHVLGVEFGGSGERDPGSYVVVAFRSSGDELEVLRQCGHPFFMLGWGRDAVGMIIDDRTDWDEVRELLVESYCALAPKKLASLVDRPGSDGAP